MLVYGYPRICPLSVHIALPSVLTAIWEDAARRGTQLHMHQVYEGPMNNHPKSRCGHHRFLSPWPGYFIGKVGVL